MSHRPGGGNGSPTPARTLVNDSPRGPMLANRGDWIAAASHTEINAASQRVEMSPL
jgi:hypothetical protein